MYKHKEGEDELILKGFKEAGIYEAVNDYSLQVKVYRKKYNMADEATLWTEEYLTTLIEKVITRALDEQQKNLFNIISGNFEILKQQIAELKKEINELRQSIEHTENVLEDKVARVEKNLGHIENRVQEIYDYQLDPSFIEDKLIDLEDRPRRNNLRVDGIKETKWNMGKLRN